MHSCMFKMATELLIKTNELQSSPTITVRSASTTVKVQTVGCSRKLFCELLLIYCLE